MADNPYQTPAAPLSVPPAAGPRIIHDTLARQYLLYSLLGVLLVQGFFWYRSHAQHANYGTTLIFVCAIFLWVIAGSWSRRVRLKNLQTVPGTRALGYANGPAGGRNVEGVLALAADRLSFSPADRSGLPTLEIPLAEIQEIETKGTRLILRRGPTRPWLTYSYTRPKEWRQAILEAKAISPVLSHSGPPALPQDESQIGAVQGSGSFHIVPAPTWTGTFLMVGFLLGVGGLMLKNSLSSTGMLYFGLFAAFVLALTSKTTWTVRQMHVRLRNRPPVPASSQPLLGGWASWSSGGKRQSGGAVLTRQTFYLFPVRSWDRPDWKIELSDVEAVTVAGSELKLRLRSLRTDFKCRLLSTPRWKEEIERLLADQDLRSADG